jgi:hypothetical protein
MNYMLRYLVGFFVTIGLVVLLIVLLFSGGSSPKKVTTTGQALGSYADTDAQVRLTIDGPINDDQDHNQVQITVDRNNAVFNQLQGYDGSVVKTESFPKTSASYAAFLYALEHADFTQGDTSSSLTDERGYCPQGSRYVFEIMQDGHDIERFWATSCGGVHTYDGELTTSLILFKAQIPNYTDLADPIGLI